MRKDWAPPALLWCVNWIDILWGPIWKWPVLLRRLYVIFLPIAWLLRAAMIVMLLIAGAILANCAVLCEYIRCAWNGERFEL